MKLEHCLAALCIALFSTVCLAETSQETATHLQALVSAGTIDTARDLAPVIARIKASKKEAEISPLLKALAKVAEPDRNTPAAAKDYLRRELPPLIFDFVRGPYSAMERDTAIMLLREIAASDADLKTGIALAKDEAEKKVPHFGNSARLLEYYLERRPGSASGAPARTTAPEKKTSDTSFGAYYDKQMKAAQQAISDKRYATARDILAGLEAALVKQDPNYGEKPRWAYVLDFKRFVLFELDNKTGAVATCEKTVRVLADNDWAYLEEYNVVRAARRACHNLLAWEKQDKARTVKEVEQAIEQIDACFETISPIEDEAALDTFFPTRIRVFMTANRLAGDKYQKALFETLAEAESRNLPLNEEDDDVKKVLSSPAYRSFKKTLPKD